MANIKYFNGELELVRVYYDNRNKAFGEDPNFVPVFDRVAQKWIRRVLPVERQVEFKRNPSRHQCDARCYNATGRTMQCECSCGGKNHGRGAFNCEAVA